MRRTETGEEKSNTAGRNDNQRTYWERGTGKTIYGHRREGNTRHGDTGLTPTCSIKNTNFGESYIFWSICISDKLFI